MTHAHVEKSESNAAFTGFGRRGLDSLRLAATRLAARAPEPRVFEFLEPRLVWPESENYLPGEDSGWVLQSKPQGASQAEVLADPAIPKLFFASYILPEIRYFLAKSGSTEFALVLLYEKVNEQQPVWLVHSYFPVGQEVSGAEVALDGPDLSRYLVWLRERFPERYGRDGLKNRWGHVHSHHSMGCFWSGTDKTQQETRGQMGYDCDNRFYVVLDNKDNMRVDLVQYFPVFHRFESCPWGLYFGEEPFVRELTFARKQELDQVMDTLFARKSFVPATAFSPLEDPGTWSLRVAEREDGDMPLFPAPVADALTGVERNEEDFEFLEDEPETFEEAFDLAQPWLLRQLMAYLQNCVLAKASRDGKQYLPIADCLALVEEYESVLDKKAAHELYLLFSQFLQGFVQSTPGPLDNAAVRQLTTHFMDAVEHVATDLAYYALDELEPEESLVPHFAEIAQARQDDDCLRLAPKEFGEAFLAELPRRPATVETGHEK